MTALYIISGVLLFLILLFLLPISAGLELKDDFLIAVKYAGIKVFDSSKKSEKSPEKETKETDKSKKENKLIKTFKEEKAKRGTADTVKYFGKIAKIILEKLLWFLRKLKFDSIVLNLTVATDNAAKTAITYGSVCTVLYPILSLITSNADVKYKQINISTDFNKTAIICDFSMRVKTRLIYAVIGLIKGYSEYKRIKKESQKNG